MALVVIGGCGDRGDGGGRGGGGNAGRRCYVLCIGMASFGCLVTLRGK